MFSLGTVWAAGPRTAAGLRARSGLWYQNLESSSSRVISMPDGFFCTDARMRSVMPPEMCKAGPKTAVN